VRQAKIPHQNYDSKLPKIDELQTLFLPKKTRSGLDSSSKKSQLLELPFVVGDCLLETFIVLYE